MKYFSAFLLLSFVAFSSCASVKDAVKDAVKVEVFNKESELLAKYPDAKPLQIADASNLLARQYVLGQRLGGDYVVARDGNNYYWPTPQDVTLTITYPQSGYGAIVTFVQIIVNQDTANGQAYVTGGGIGQRFIQIAVLAGGTRNFSFNLEIYGY